MTGARDTAQRASALRAAGRSDDAIRLLHEALATDPEDEGLLDQLARAQLDTDPKAAFATAVRLVSIAPDSADAHYVAALAGVGAGQTKKALEHARRVVELAPWWSAGHAIHAETLARRPRQQKAAAAAAARAVELDPHSLPGYIAAGNAELVRGKPREAETWFRRSLELDPHNRVAQGNLVIAHEAAGRLAPAFADTGALLRFDPTDADARAQLDELVRTTLVHLQWIVVVLAVVALRSTFSLLSNRDVIRALPWPYIHRLPRRNVWVGILTLTVGLSLPLALLALALPGAAGVGAAGFASLVALVGLASSGVRAIAANRWFRR